MHEARLYTIDQAKKDGSWFALDHLENLVIPEDLQKAFDTNTKAYTNYLKFSPSYRKSYLYWLFSAKRDATRLKRIEEIISLCEKNIKSKGDF